MTQLTMAGTLLAADKDTRTIRGLLLPYGEIGRTSAGAVTVTAGVVEIPNDPQTVVLNVGHDRDKPIGRATALEDTEAGLIASFSIANTRRGDDMLAEVSENLRMGLSVELDNISIRAGKLLGGILTDVGLVTKPAFPSALLTAADTDIEISAQTEDPKNEVKMDTVMITGENLTVGEVTPADEVAAPETAEASKASKPALTAAKAPLGFTSTKSQTVKPQDAFRLIAQSFENGDAAALTAALSDVTAAGVATSQAPAWVGEMWAGKSYTRKYVNLLNQQTLTSLKVNGWQWVNKPVMADYLGNKTAVPSNPVSVEAVSTTAKRLAGAWDIDRALFDFADQGFIASFLNALTESYARLSDDRALDAIVAAATDNTVTPGSVPTGVNAGLAAIVDGASAIIDTATPSFAIVAKDVYRSVLLTRSDDSLSLLNASLGLEDGTVASFKVIPGDLPAGDVIVGAKEAISFYELGSTPVRVEAENIGNGGRDLGVFGYYASLVQNAAAIALVSA